jgi:hypothetical protein
MSGMVKAYFDKHVPILDHWINQDLQLGTIYEELKCYLNEARAEWNHIPLEEKQIPYLEIEKPFWHAFHTLSLLFVSDVELSKKKKLFEEFEAIKACYISRGPLPEGYDAMRPLP